MNMKKRFKPKKNDNSHIIKVRPKLDWSEYQKSIFRNVFSGTGNTAVIARAGSSKTTSLVEAIRYVPKGKKVLVAAFNVKIADELKSRVSKKYDVATLHSLGFQAIKQRFGNVELDNKKCFNIVSELLGDVEFEVVTEICRAVSLCKSSLSDVPSKIIDLIDKYDIEYSPFEINKFVSIIIQVLGLCKKKTNIIDYDDMIYFPFVYNINIGKWDAIFIDEAQDMSYSMLIMALSAAREGSRIFIFLDDRQAIYGFRGCDIESVNSILTRLNPTKLSLPISYRCPQNVVRLAQKIVPDIQVAPNAIEGNVENMLLEDMLKVVKCGDYIISRTNAPLVKLCLSLLRNNIPANIQGRDIGSNLLYFIKKSKAKTIDKFIEYLERWKEAEIKRLTAEKKDLSICVDKAETLSSLCEDCLSIKDLKSKIEKLFDDKDDKNRVLLGTTHKLKGTEADNVFLLRWTYRPSCEGQESNVYYVGITRARKNLYLVYRDKKYVQNNQINGY
jgi:DNA helicase-2/ATP-dependent DNA helicase PcrA